MAKTYTPKDALDLIRKYAKDLPLSGANEDILLCDQVNAIIHTAGPWDWSLANLTSVALSDGVQDYTLTDTFFRVVNARITRTDTTPDQSRELNGPVEFLPPELIVKGGIEGLQAFSISGTTLRLDKAASVPSGVVLRIDGEYQKNPAKITKVTSTFDFDDRYFHVFVDGLLWRIFVFMADSRAGEVRVNKGGDRTYTGQMGAFFASLAMMGEAEGFSFGSPLIFPQNPLGVTEYRGGYNIYGY